MKLLHKKTESTAPTEVVAPEPAEAVAPAEAPPTPAVATESSWLDDAFAEGIPMKVEVRRDGGRLVVRAELPGIDPDKDIEVSVGNGMLRIHGERREETSSDQAGGHRTVLRYGAFTRVLPLPAGATEADVKATYVDGVLEVQVPVDAEAAAAQRVPVTST
jgi:HSP20 family protein